LGSVLSPAMYLPNPHRSISQHSTVPASTQHGHSLGTPSCKGSGRQATCPTSFSTSAPTVPHPHPNPQRPPLVLANPRIPPTSTPPRTPRPRFRLLSRPSRRPPSASSGALSRIVPASTSHHLPHRAPPSI
jgi:hypothetical protein